MNDYIKAKDTAQDDNPTMPKRREPCLYCWDSKDYPNDPLVYDEQEQGFVHRACQRVSEEVVP
jgi:hypothetical protein